LAVNGRVDANEQDGIIVSRTFNVDVDRYLDHHRLDGRPVLPFAVASALMAETAALANPTLQVSEVRAIRMLNGLTFDQDAKSVQVIARLDRPESDPQGSWTDASVTMASLANPNRLHYRSTVRLRESLEPASLDEPLEPLGESGPLPMSIEEVYATWLFHGPVFQRIAAIDRIGPAGASAWLRPSAPAEAFSTDPGCGWLIDPILVDGALQVQVIWARMHWDVTLLPTELGSIQRFGTIDPHDGPLRYELRIRHESSAPLCHADHYFFDRHGTLVGRLQDVVGAGSRELNRLAGSTR
jgi:hypothetical protein